MILGVAVRVLCFRRSTFNAELSVPLIHEFPLRAPPPPVEEATVGWAIQAREDRRNAHVEKKVLATSRSARKEKREAAALAARMGKGLDTDEGVILDARLYLRGVGGFGLSEYVPDMGGREGKFRFVVKHSNGSSYLMTATPSVFDYSSHAKVLDKVLAGLRNPYVLPTLKADFRSDRSMIVTWSNYAKRGSLKDYMRRVKNPKAAYYVKYAHSEVPMDPVDGDRAAKIGRQILEGLLYLRAVGCPYGHLSAQNVIIENGVCRLTDVQNAFANLSPAMARFTSRFRDREERDVVALAHILYELCAGFELEESTPDYFPHGFPRPIRKVIRAILAPKGDTRPMLEDLVELPVFADVRLTEPDDEETRISKTMRSLLQYAMRREQPPVQLRMGAGFHVEDDSAGVGYEGGLEYVGARGGKQAAVDRVTEKSMIKSGRVYAPPPTTTKKAKAKAKAKAKGKDKGVMEGASLMDAPNEMATPAAPSPSPSPPPPPPPPPVAAAPPPPPPPPPPSSSSGGGAAPPAPKPVSFLDSIASFSKSNLKSVDQ